MRNFKELQVWQKSHLVVIEIYRITKAFPSDERFGLVSQIRRSAASVPANIAEGCVRKGDRDFSRFLSIAAGSASETQYHLLLSHELKFLGKNDYMEIDRQIKEVKRMLYGFMKRLTPDT
ncbi:MAG: four helix bundle protein [Thermodesulfobacteriota bacterium]|nr:four helix bundle protein [Thermodesulfobacteriota bacterium]